MIQGTLTKCLQATFLEHLKYLNIFFMFMYWMILIFQEFGHGLKPHLHGMYVCISFRILSMKQRKMDIIKYPFQRK